MKLFNIDLHISVIEDLKTICADLGHSIDSVCLSNHNWVFGRDNVALSSVYHNAILTNVHGMEYSITQEYCDQFYEDYKDALGKYDGFVVTYPPLFSLLYEKFNKPIYTVAAIRYDYPLRSTDRKSWFNEKIKLMTSTGQLIPIANNKYDALYWKINGGIEATVIPSLCSYVKCHGGVYTGTGGIIVHGKERLYLYDHVRDLGHYSWNQLYSHAGIIHIPYNVSTMSIFEQYTAGVPMFFPSIDASKSFKSFLSEAGELVSHELAYQSMDFYDESMMPHLLYFSSLSELYDKVIDTDYPSVHNAMIEYSKVREKIVYDAWGNLLK
jgi:hypothetical protein